jgi:hypothetical protein
MSDDVRLETRSPHWESPGVPGVRWLSNVTLNRATGETNSFGPGAVLAVVRS